ncbi:hypothetical protein [Celerinatantimonas sp. MCCC 1A17872]|uniref:hypothetical protein n=1 Tax=Celerinatantimonas sp. MCCC 1A17872 TaxID=3177514 RepID=UPI0038CAF6C4
MLGVQIDLNGIEKLQIGLSLIMLFPLWVAIKGVLVYLDLTNPVNYEGLHIVGFVLLYSSVVWLPFTVVCIFKWADISNLVLCLSGVPFIVFAMIVVFSFFNGLRL